MRRRINIAFLLLLLMPEVRAQKIYGTGNGTIGINQFSVGWSNASLGGGTPDLSSCTHCIVPACTWDISPTNPTPIVLPIPPTGDTIFADVGVGRQPYNNLEIIKTNITGIVIGKNYTIKMYLLTAVSKCASEPTLSYPSYFPSSVEVVIEGDTTIIQLDSSTHNKWELFTIDFVPNATSVPFVIGNAKPYINGSSKGGGLVCISIADNAISCSTPVNLGSDTVICTNTPLLLDPSISNSTYVWQDNSIDSTYLVTNPGTYSVFVNTPNCWSYDTINIGTKPLPLLQLGNDTNLRQCESLRLDVSAPNATYYWKDGSTNSTYTISEQGNYWVKITSDGCSNVDSINVGLQDCDCSPQIPNVFTPNEDGINDKWIITQYNCIFQLDVSIYNRYGTLIYHSENYNNDWDGTYHNKPCTEGTYYYLIKSSNPDPKEQVYKGYVSILR